VATNLAVGLAEDDKYKVVLVDADLQFGDVAVFLNLSTNRTMADLIPQLDELETEMVGEVVVPHYSGIKVLLAPPRPEMAELVSAESVRTLVLTLREDFDYVIVDTHSSLDDVTLAVLDAADKVLAITTPEVPAVKDARIFLELVEALGYPTEKIMLGANKVYRNGTITSAEIEESANQKLGFLLGRDDAVAAAAINQGEPAIMGDPNSFLGKGIKALVEKIVALTQEPEEAESPAAGPASQKANGARSRSGLLSALRR
jgi:pilus assembly protein CpaE